MRNYLNTHIYIYIYIYINPKNQKQQQRLFFSEREEKPHQKRESFSAREKRDPTRKPTGRFQRERRETPPVARNNPTCHRRRLFVGLLVWFSLHLLKLGDRVSISTLRTISTVRACFLYKLRLDFGVLFEYKVENLTNMLSDLTLNLKCCLILEIFP